MARMLSWPDGLRWNRMKWLAGPESIGSGSNTTIGDVTQTVASPFGARYLQMSFPPLRGALARRARGMVTGLHRGANAIRVQVCDWDGLSLAAAGANFTREQIRNGIVWDNGMPWENGMAWAVSRPHVSVSSAAAKDSNVVRLATGEFWGATRDIGDWIGFFPFHFGLYEVTEVVAPGVYRVWPPLRKAIDTSTKSTLNPTMAMRLLANNIPDAERGLTHLEGLTISLFEVPDYSARAYFDD